MSAHRLSAASALFLTLAPLLWAGNAVAGRWLAGWVAPVTLNFLRWALAALVLLPLAHTPCLALPIFHRPPPAELAVLRGWPARLRPSHFLKDENAMLRFLFNLLWFILGGLPMALGTGALGLLGNLVWFVFAGLWLALGHLGSALVCFVTLIGIPFGWQHLKLAAIALMPIGKTIVVRR